MEANAKQEREIPVFTVMKNNAILKNIFVINSRSSISDTHPKEQRDPQHSSKTCQDLEHNLLVGRHPDCDIRLEHPSISRFHLRIHSRPSFKRLSVTDLSSVHGTWISGKRMQPNIRVDVNEGDALKIGGSSRIYRLHWIPFHKAYDLNNPFVPPIDVPLPDEEMEEEIKRDENTLVLENEGQFMNSASPKELLSSQSETSEEIEDVNTLVCENEDEKFLVLGCEFSLDSALEAVKALVSNQSEASTEMENDNALVFKTENEKIVDSPSEEASKDLAFNPSQEEEEVLSVAPPPEAMNALDVPSEIRDMQFVKFAWEGSETLLLDRSPLLLTPEESKLSLVMQEVDYSHGMVAKNEVSPLVLKLDDMSIPGDMKDDGEKEGNASGSSTGPLRELEVDLLKENEYEKENENQQVEQGMESPRDLFFSRESSSTETQLEFSSVPALTSNSMENFDDAISESFTDEALHINENPVPPCDDEEMATRWNFWSLSNQGLEDEHAMQVRHILAEDPRDLLFSQESLLTEIQWDSFNLPASTYNLMDNLDDTISETYSDETLHVNEHLLPPSDDEKMGAAWSFWSLSTQGLEDDNSTQARNSLVEDLSSGEIQSSIWSFWSGIPGAESVHSSSLSDAELFQKETQSTNCSPCCIHSMETLCSEPSEERSPDRAAPIVWSERGQLAASLESHTNRTTQEKVDSNGINIEVRMLNDGRYDPINRPCFIDIDTVRERLEEEYFTQFSNATAEGCIDSEESLSAYFNKENQTPTALQEQKSTLFVDSPQMSVSEAHISSARLSAYSNKENQTPKPLQEQKSAQNSSENCLKLFKSSKGKEQRTAMQTSFADSPQKSFSDAHISGASLSAYSNKENQTPKALQEKKSSRYSSAKCMKLSIPSKGEEQRTPLRALIVDSPQMSVSEAHISGASLTSYSNKENQTPKALQKQKPARHSSAKCMKLSIPSKGEEQRMPLRALIVDIPQESSSKTHTSHGVSFSACSNKENQKQAGNTKLLSLKKQAKTMPFQTLFGDSPQKNISDPRISGVSARSRDSTTYYNTKNNHSKQQVKMWIMLVDVPSLLNKTSRKALELLEGIKGTQLIIPDAVVKELDVMKQQASFFRKNTEAFLASQWIEECMVRNDCWVQIQSCMAGDGSSTALTGSTPSYYCAFGTLPANENVSSSTGDQVLDYAIYLRRIQKDGQLVLLSDDSTMKIKAMAEVCVFGTLPANENVSSSTGDQVLDYAIYLRRIQKDGQLVLLSDDSTMKIKAMAEGLICETAQEFRQSLVNPFSKRFLWINSSPRGRTWSYLDDVILRKKFYPCAIKGVENVKGLKTLLFLDSTYK